MNINANSMFNDMQSMIAKTQMQTPSVNTISTNSLESLDRVNATSTANSDFSAMLKSAVDHVNGIQKHSAALQTAVEMGDRSVSISDAMIASQKAGVAFSATVEVRNKFVEAYKEIMSMPV